MALDKSWMDINDRREATYRNGVDNFIDYAFERVADMGTIPCPCVKCRNVLYKDRDEVRYHLLRYGIVKNYKTWYSHGEPLPDDIDDDSENASDVAMSDDLINMLNDLSGPPESHAPLDQDYNGGPNAEDPLSDSAQFYQLLRAAKQKLYPGCEHSKLSAVVKLLHLKSFCRWTNASFDKLMQFLIEIVPDGKQTLPNSFRSAHKFIADLGMDYVKYDVCKNNCVVYWDCNENAQHCPVCGLSRWKVAKRTDGGDNIPHKLLRYFPIKNRLQRLFMSSKTASEMRWHKEHRVDDGIMRHPADSLAWKSFDNQHVQFARDARNVRLGLATDGFQPFGNMSSQHSLWPVVLMVYNLPPWMCMKQPYFIMPLLIPGPHSPGMGIDVFLEPLIKELKELWEDGVQTFDAHAKQHFRMRAAVLWTVNDFPAYADLSGWSTKGYMACPSCHKDTSSRRLNGSRKICYMGHRRFLRKNHKWRHDAMAFDGTVETRMRPKPLSGEDALREVESFQQAPFGRGVKRKYDNFNSFKNWRKKSILFCLPYWKTLLIRHNLDVMHIEKNVCDNILGTIMDIKGKTKDTLGSRYDLASMGIRPELHPKCDGNFVRTAIARYTLSNNEKSTLCNMLMSLRTPDGFLSNISRCVNEKERKISGMKSHDYHVFIQRLLPIAIRGFLPNQVCEPLVELSALFRDLCRKSLEPTVLERMKKNVVLTLCKLEMIFPPSFFDVMVHLVVHLPEEASLAGPVQYRWMFPIERYLRTLKAYVRNKARPEGSIAEAYIVDECLTFCSRYLEGIDTKFNQPSRYVDRPVPINEITGLAVFNQGATPFGCVKYESITHDLHHKAQLYVLNNCQEVEPYVLLFKGTLGTIPHPQFLRRYNAQFPEWLRHHVIELHERGEVSDDMLTLSLGPSFTCKQYQSIDVNGFRFHTSSRDQSRKTQNSGILCRGDDSSTEKEYYGVLQEIWELQYTNGKSIQMLKCEWFDLHHHGSGYRVDGYGITSVNLNRRLCTNEPFIMASQAEQVFYVQDPKDPSWAVVMKTQPRDLYSIPRNTNDDNEVDKSAGGHHEAYQEDVDDDDDLCARVGRPLDLGDDLESLNRVDIEPQSQPIQIALEVEDRMNKDALCDADFIDNNRVEGTDNSGSDESEYETSDSEDD